MATLPPVSGAPTAAPGPQDSPVDIVTLESLALKLGKWDPNAKSHLFALVDMGSNGIRFSVSDLSPARARLLPCLYQERAPISLLDALLEGDPSTADHGRAIKVKTQDKFPEATILAVTRTLSRFRSIAVDGYHVPPENLLVFATEAMRRASNAADMLKAIADAAPGTVVHVLEPKVETLLGAMGARSSFVNVRGLFVDLGGGSLQISYLSSAPEHIPGTAGAASVGPADAGATNYGVAAARAGQSLPFGAARMTHIIEQEDSRVLEAEVDGLQSRLAAAVENLRRAYPALAADLAADGPGVGLYLYGGGLRGYGSMLRFNDDIDPYPLTGVGSYSVSGRYFAETKKMRKVNKKHKDKIPGMSGRRRQQFPAIATVVEAIVAAVPKIRWATFCGGGNREGALMMILPESLRESNPLDLLSRRDNGSGNNSAPSQGAVGLSVLTGASAVEFITSTLIEALPESLAAGPCPANVFSLGLGALFVGSIWSGVSGTSGDDDESASSVLHHTLGRDPGAPGLGHLERAVLAVTLVSRWGGAVSVSDTPLLERLRAVVAATHVRPMGSGEGHGVSKGAGPSVGSPVFWADYIGATAAALAKVTAAYPADLLAGGPPRIRFRSTSDTKLGKDTVNLTMDVALPDVLDFDLADLTAPFKKMGKKEGIKVVALAQFVPPWV